MNRDNTIEKLMLSRCSRYHDDGAILEVLEHRYSLTGSQKNFLVLEPTTGGLSHAEIVEGAGRRKRRKQKQGSSILGALKTGGAVNAKRRKDNKHNALKTRNEFKRFIKENLALQKRCTRKIKQLVKNNPHYLDDVDDLASLGFCEAVLKFEDFLSMNALWNKYARDLIGEGAGNIATITSKLSSAEYIGAFIEVTHSGCVDNVGKVGIIIWESQYNFVIVVPREDGWKQDAAGLAKPNCYSIAERIGGIRIINKQDTRFRLTVGVDDKDAEDTVIEFDIIGDRMTVRSIDRANKKFKPHSVKDIRL